jgi:hypothetical protein
MTTTHRAPQILAAHAGLLGVGMPDPVADPARRPERMQVGAVMTEPSCVKVQAWPADDPATVFESAWVPTAAGTDPTNPVNVAKFFLAAGAGAAGQAWRWRTYCALAGTRPDAPLSAAYGSDGVLRTLPDRPQPGRPARFSVAVGCCSQIAHPGRPNRPIPAAAAIAASGVIRFVHLGDTSYVDDWHEYLEDTAAHTYTKFACGLRGHLTQPDLRGVYDTVSSRMVLDDHDSGPDNDYAASAYPQARQVFTDVAAGTSFGNASWSKDAPGAPTYDTWVDGQAQFWLLDCRLHADTPGTQLQSFGGQPYSSQLGATQRNWLKQGLAASTASAKIVLSPRAFTQYYPGPEQQEILDWITGYRSGTARVGGTVVFVTGDKHAAAVWQVGASGRVYELLCAPLLNTTKHNLTALSSWQQHWGYRVMFMNTANGGPGLAVSNSWGRLDIDTTGPGNRIVTLNVLRDDGATLYHTQVG